MVYKYGAKQRRMGRIFRSDGKTLIVAMDHAGAMGPVPGLEDPGQVIRQVLAGGADVIMTTYGVATRFTEAIGRAGLILRVDGGTSMLSEERSSMSLVYDAIDALRVGADGVVCMGFPGSRFESETLPYLASLVAQCREWALPVLAEMLPGGFEDPGKWWTVENVAFACRLGAEMGVDFIKTQYTGDPESFRQVVETTYVPIVVLGGGRMKTVEGLLSTVYDAIQAGAKGVAIGRNIYQYPEPRKITAALAAIIHDEAMPKAASKLL
jgi:DhnA family fructose-bisphosphate aldolase class Ia